jgi:hypothetical protein
VRTPAQQRKSQKSVVFTGLLLFGLVLLIIQLWLFVSALEGILAGKTSMVVPGAVASLAILAVNVWMLVGLQRMVRSD